MKKLICMFLSVAMLLFCPLITAKATGTTVRMENSFLQKGEKVSLTVSFDAGEQMQAFEYTLEYDQNVLVFVSASGGVYNNYESGKIKYIGVGNGTTDTVTFTFRATAAGNTAISVTEVFAANEEEHSYPSASYNFTVDEPTRGDANGDGKIDAIDLAALKLYLAGTGREISGFADYNLDSDISATDLALLKLYLVEG